MNWYQVQRSKRARAAVFDRDERARRRLAELPPAMASPELTGLTETEIAEEAEAEARRITRLPWWDQLSDQDKATSEAARRLSRYLST
jgi:hypothetical protein